MSKKKVILHGATIEMADIDVESGQPMKYGRMKVFTPDIRGMVDLLNADVYGWPVKITIEKDD